MEKKRKGEKVKNSEQRQRATLRAALARTNTQIELCYMLLVQRSPLSRSAETE